jgi:hypothetical protein
LPGKSAVARKQNNKNAHRLWDYDFFVTIFISSRTCSEIKCKSVFYIIHVAHQHLFFSGLLFVCGTCDFHFASNDKPKAKPCHSAVRKSAKVPVFGPTGDAITA